MSIPVNVPLECHDCGRVEAVPESWLLIGPASAFVCWDCASKAFVFTTTIRALPVKSVQMRDPYFDMHGPEET